MPATPSKNARVTQTDTVRIKVSDTYCLVSLEDFPRLPKQSLRLNDRGHVVFGRVKALHRYLRPDLAKIGFRDGNTLNLTRENLVPWVYQPLVRVERGITRVPAGYKVTGYKPGPKKHAIAYHLGVYTTLGKARQVRDREAHLYFPKRRTL